MPTARRVSKNASGVSSEPKLSYMMFTATRSALFFNKKIAQLGATALDVLKNVIFEIEATLGAPDGVKNVMRARWAINQQLDSIARDQRRFGDRLLDEEMALQGIQFGRPYLSFEESVNLPENSGPRVPTM